MNETCCIRFKSLSAGIMWVYVVAVICVWYAFLTYIRSLRIRHSDAKCVVITGCDSGFGQALARSLDKQCLRVCAGCYTEGGVLTLRNESSGRLTSFLLDITSDDSVRNALDIVTKSLGDEELWGLVNNAGQLGDLAPFEMLTISDVHKTIDCNLYGMMRVTKAFLPLLRKSRGRIVNTTSAGGRLATLSVPYTVSKYAGEGFSDRLRLELYHSGVTVHIIEPGGFRTALFDADRVQTAGRRIYDGADAGVQRYYGWDCVNGYIEFNKVIFGRVLRSEVSSVVDAYTHALTSRFPKYRYLVGWDAILFVWPLIHMPEFIQDFVGARLRTFAWPAKPNNSIRTS